MSLPTIYVLGLGNVLMGDDGFGPAVVQSLQAQYVLGPNVDVVDLGTPGLDLAPWLADAAHVILIDTVNAKLPAGTLHVYGKDDLVRQPPAARVGPHDPGVTQALLALDFAGIGPRTLTLIGVIPGRLAMSTTLSPPVQDAVPKAIHAVVAELVRLGEVVAQRDEPLPLSTPWNPLGA